MQFRIGAVHPAHHGRAPAGRKILRDQGRGLGQQASQQASQQEARQKAREEAGEDASAPHP
jgi:hypothetical protein